MTLLGGGAFAQPQKTFVFDLPAQPLSEALKEYARLSGQQIIFTEALVKGYIARSVHGTLTADDALHQLLEGTGLFAEHASAGAVMVRRADRAAAASPPPPPEPAKALPAEPSEQVVVTGLIYSLQTNLDIKRKAGGLVDVISAEDIGKFPDVDLAAAMQRIPGVTVSRGVSSIGGTPTSIGTATQVTVRGFGPNFNETLFNNRKIASGIGRAFDFSSVGADFVSEIDVMKSPDAALSSGAIGATINIKFPKPFDHPGMNLVGSASGNFSPEEGNVSPNFKLLFSDTFNHDTFGVLLDAGYSNSRTRGHHVNIQGWEGVPTCDTVANDPGCSGMRPTQFASARAPGTPNWFIQDYGLYQETTQDTRIDGRLALQWRPREDILVTLDDNYSRDTLHAVQYGYSVWFNAASLNNVVGNSNGTITSFIQPNTPTDFQGQINGSILQNNDTGINLRWDAGKKLSLNLDYDRSQAWQNPGGKLSSIDADVGYGPSTQGGTNGNNVGVVVPDGHQLPYPTGFGPNGDPAKFLNNGLIGSHVLPLVAMQRFDRIQQLRAEAVWTENDRLKLSAGYQFIGDHDDARAYSDFPNNQWQAYAGYGPASNNIGTHGAALPQSLFANSFSTSNFINGFGGSQNLPARIVAFDAYAVLNYLQGLGNPQTTAIAGFNSGCCSPAFDGTYALANVAGSYSQVVENTHAGYITILAETNVADMPLKLNAGLRAEYTGVTTIGLVQLPTLLTIQPSDHTAFNVGFGTASPVSGYNSYRSLLPNLDLTLGVTDELQLRFDVSRTLTRPPLNQITPALSVPTAERVGSLVATGSNPNLMPYLSDNIDLSAEWYYQPNSYLSLDAFSKSVANFVVQGSTQQPIANVVDPTTGQPAVFTVSTNINGPSADVYGLEVAVQHVFGASGFGFQANATLVGTNKPYNPRDLAVSGFAVTGLADSANLVAFYEKDGLQARIAANWRDNYLDHFGQTQNNSRFGTEPTFVNASMQLDFSASYAITPSLTAYLSALNLNDATFSTHGRFSEQLLDAVDYDRRFTVGIHFRY